MSPLLSCTFIVGVRFGLHMASLVFLTERYFQGRWRRVCSLMKIGWYPLSDSPSWPSATQVFHINTIQDSRDSLMTWSPIHKWSYSNLMTYLKITSHDHGPIHRTLTLSSSIYFVSVAQWLRQLTGYGCPCHIHSRIQKHTKVAVTMVTSHTRKKFKIAYDKFCELTWDMS